MLRAEIIERKALFICIQTERIEEITYSGAFVGVVLEKIFYRFQSLPDSFVHSAKRKSVYLHICYSRSVRSVDRLNHKVCRKSRVIRKWYI